VEIDYVQQRTAHRHDYASAGRRTQRATRARWPARVIAAMRYCRRGTVPASCRSSAVRAHRPVKAD